MNTYFIAETNHRNALAKADAVQASSLTQAKRLASKMQFFQGTVMSIGLNVNEDGLILNPIAQKIDGRWI